MSSSHVGLFSNPFLSTNSDGTRPAAAKPVNPLRASQNQNPPVFPRPRASPPSRLRVAPQGAPKGAPEGAPAPGKRNSESSFTPPPPYSLVAPAVADAPPSYSANPAGIVSQRVMSGFDIPPPYSNPSAQYTDMILAEDLDQVINAMRSLSLAEAAPRAVDNTGNALLTRSFGMPPAYNHSVTSRFPPSSISVAEPDPLRLFS
ncbi:Uu.00g131820.m01.CDS01 [Anthostomella pinea]|uniref:Uu.00g131820.m01.CDS01 n=1 Tax=Anthostomella pinea TaxID=933095 RepID=A0AAI8YFW4_9PEZI|nr:Uu.00g131820.m01.CDS01 [Anthostomella pinea]